ncbi:MAG: ribosomal-protein-alanine N-acetyltransferase, partial [Actinomycetales bacterium]
MIRPADDGDLAALVELEREAFGQGAWSAATLREELALPDRIVLVDEHDG